MEEQIISAMFIVPKWFVIYTRSRHEKFVETSLTSKGIESFTPTVLLRRKWSDRVKFIEQPFFKSYCFAKFPLKDKRTVLAQQGVVNIVHFKDQYVPVPDSVIESLKILTKNKIKIDPYPYFDIGERIRIKNGPLRGVEGYVIEKRKSNTSLAVSVEAIAASIKCIVDACDVEPA
ncbi:MAG: UpxY family transcription antiterminator [Candidatus Omnitrophota bacterium]